MTTKLEILYQPNGGYLVTVDGASKECASWTEALHVVEAEGDMPLAKAHKELWEKCKKLEEEKDLLNKVIDEMEADRDKYKDWWLKAYQENQRLKEAIAKYFVEAYK